MTHDDTPAFSVPDISTGMSLRDYMAGQALMGILSSADVGQFSEDTIAFASYKQADAMMKARQE